MREIEEFAKLIQHAEKRKAAVYIKDLYKKTPCKNYADALTAVILREASVILGEKIPGFYIDEEFLMEKMFSGGERLCADEIADLMCCAVKNAACEDKKRSFAKADSYIKQNLTDCRLYPGAVAGMVGISQSQLTKLFEEFTGKAPSEYLSALRVEKSIYLLEKSGGRVKDTAILSGFSSAEAYIRAFKKIYGVTPGKYKKE